MKKIAKLFFLFTLIGIIFLTLRINYTGKFTYIFFVWNLFLAWIPFLLSLWIYKIFKKKPKKGMIIFGIFLGIIWLLFFPNAPYLLTDYIHLDGYNFMTFTGEDSYFKYYVFNSNFLMWFDFIIMSIFIWTGVLLGFVSLYIMEKAVELKDGTNYKGGFVASVLLLTSLGIYIGRFMRFNSWDLFTNPLSIVRKVFESFNMEMLLFVLSFWVLLMIMYYSITGLKLLFNEK